MLHKGPIAALEADPMFLYSAGASDFQLAIWDADMREQRLRINLRGALGPEKQLSPSSLTGLVRPTFQVGRQIESVHRHRRLAVPRHDDGRQRRYVVGVEPLHRSTSPIGEGP